MLPSLRNGAGSDTFLPSPLYRERRSLYETHHTASGHHDPNPFGSKRGGAGGGDRLRRSAKLGRWAGRVHPEGYKRCRSGRHYRGAGSPPRGRGDPQGRDKAARRRRRRDRSARQSQGRLALLEGFRTGGYLPLRRRERQNRQAHRAAPARERCSVSGFTIRGFNSTFILEGNFARNATFVGNRSTGNVASGIAFAKSVNTTIAKNHVPETDKYSGILVGDGSRNTKIVNNVVRSIPEGHPAIEAFESHDTTIAGNDLIGNWAGVLVSDSTGTKILSNDISRSGETGIVIFGPERADNDAKVVGNNISGGAWGMYVANTKGGF